MKEYNNQFSRCHKYIQNSLGYYKERPNHALKKANTLHTYVNPLLVPAQKDQLFDWIDSNFNDSSNDLHPVVLSLIAYNNFCQNSSIL